MDRGSQPRLAYLDTHVVAWLHDGLVDRLSRTARDAVESFRLVVSPIVELELSLLREIGRFRPVAARAIAALGDEIGLEYGSVPLRRVVEAAARQTWTRDPFDRIVVGEALAAGAALITKDDLIRHHCRSAIW